MPDSMIQLTAVTMGLVQVIKPFLPDKDYSSLVSVLIGVIVSMFYAAVSGTPIARAGFDGVIVGLISCGAYDVATMGYSSGKEDDEEDEEDL